MLRSQEFIEPAVLLLETAGEPLTALGRDLEPCLLWLDSFADQLQTVRPFLGLLQSLFLGQFQGAQQRRREFTQCLEKTTKVDLKDLVVLPQPGRFGHDLEQKRAQIVEGDASLRAKGLGVLAADRWRTLTVQEGSGHARADGRQEPNLKLASLRIKILENREMSDQGNKCGLQFVGGDVRQLLLELGASHGVVRIPDHLDNSLGGRILQRPNNPAGPALVHDVNAQDLIKAHKILDTGIP